MAPKPKKPALSPSIPTPIRAAQNFAGRNGLGAYIKDPTSFPSSRVIYHNDDFVAIHDLFPKAEVHTLLLPRGKQSSLHPFDAFQDEEFLAAVRVELPSLVKTVASELRRKFGQFSVQDQAREKVLNGEVEGELPIGRNWEEEVMVGIHAVPSMAHLHVHVLSRDRHSECLKHRKHYNSFSTDFFVPMDAFPLAEDDLRRSPGKEGFLNRDFGCWRCGKEFGNKFAQLKAHLEVEFDAWKRE